MIDPFLYWFAAGVLLALDLVTQAAQSSLLNARPVRLLSLRPQQEIAADRTLSLIGELSRLRLSLRLVKALLRALLLGLTLVFFVPAGALTLFSISAVLVLAALLVWLGEFLVEWAVLRDPESWAMRLTPYGRALVTLATPVVALPLAVFRAGAEPESQSLVTEDELKTLVDAGQQGGVIELDEREMIYSIFRLGDTLAREVMVPRIDVFALNVHTPIPAAVDSLLKTGFSRVPVYDENLDNILGLLYAKDLLRMWQEGNHEASLRALLRQAYYIPEAKKVVDLLAEMQAQRVHLAIVVDEYGGMAGLVTLEDIVEEIIGEIQDEYDQAEELPFEQVGDDEYIFLGRIDLDDFNQILSSQLGTEEAETLGGLIYSHMGRVPKTGEGLVIDDIALTIEQVLGRRIRKVRATRVSPVQENEEEKAHADG